MIPKFRAWLKEPEIMQYSDKLSSFFKDYENTNVPIMQFTCLRDRNKKDIYGGDIVTHFDFTHPNFRHEVVFQNGAFGYVTLSSGFIPYAGNNSFNWKDGKSYEIEVLGNIYQNPELLQEKK